MTHRAGLAGLAVLLALLLGYASRAFFDADQFANRASAALSDDAVSDRVATKVADELVEEAPNLVAFQPVLESVVAGIVRSGAFQGVFRAGVRDLHRAVLDGDTGTLTLTLVDIGATLRGALEAIQPKLAKRIPADRSIALVDGEMPGWAADLARVADAARWLPILLLILGAAFAVGAARLAGDSRAGILRTGVAMTICAALALVALRGVEAVVLGGIDEQEGRDAASGVFDAFLGDLRTALLLLAGAGAVIAAAASSLLRPVDIRGQLERAWEVASRVPERPVWRVARAALLITVGLLIVVRNDAFLSLVATAIGIYVAYAGVAELMRLTISAPERAGSDQRRGVTAIAAGAIAAVVIVAAGAIFIGAGGISQGSLAVATTGCNGSEELCDRTYDEVAIPATHNSMSGATYPNYLFAQQEAGISEQLQAGVRGLMIDAHYGVETQDGTIKTDLSDLSRGERATYEAELGSAALDAALRIRDRIVNSPEAGEPGVYLCHRFCELGAVPIDRAFGEIRDFMAANADEVLTVVIEDYVDPTEIEAAAERTGLIDHIYEGPVGEPWPTLQQMIDSGGGVLMMAEQEAGGGAIPWYHQAYEGLVQETPFSFKRPALLTDPANLEASCEPNRGTPDSSLFLINHWIDTSPAPRPSNAAIVNTREALLRRIRTCEEQRDLLAGLVAIDFYREGDVFGAVAELNAER